MIANDCKDCGGLSNRTLRDSVLKLLLLRLAHPQTIHGPGSKLNAIGDCQGKTDQILVRHGDIADLSLDSTDSKDHSPDSASQQLHLLHTAVTNTCFCKMNITELGMEMAITRAVTSWVGGMYI